MRLVLTALLIGTPVAAALADAPPPHDAKPLSQLLHGLENSQNFGYFDEVEWEHGTYEVKYYTDSGTKKKVYINPVTEQQRP